MRSPLVLLLLVVPPFLAGCATPSDVPAPSDVEAVDAASVGAWSISQTATLETKLVGLVTVGSMGVDANGNLNPAAFLFLVPRGTTRLTMEVVGDGEGYLTTEAKLPKGGALYGNGTAFTPDGSPIPGDLTKRVWAQVDDPDIGDWTLIIRPHGGYVGRVTLTLTLEGQGNVPATREPTVYGQ